MMKQIQVVAALALAIGSSVSAQEAFQWRSEDGGNGHWYRIVVRPYGPYNWNAARADAQATGGDLASFEAPAEWGFMRSRCRELPAGTVTQFLAGGQRQPGANSPWVWLTGEPFSYFAWNAGVPNDGTGENFVLCVGSGTGGPSDFDGWDDWRINDLSSGYVVEWSADCNNDGIVDYGQCRDGTLPDDNGNNIPDCCEQSVQCPQDCNGNNIRDDVDLASGRAIDGDMDGVLDECGSASPLPRVRTMMVTRGADLCGAWDTNNIGVAYLWDMWVSRSGPDGPWINRPDSASGTPLTLQAQLRQGVNELTLRYEPNGCGASLKTVSLWLTDGPNPTLSGIAGTPSAPYAGVVPGLVNDTLVPGAGVVEQTVGDWIVRLASFTWSSGSDIVGPVSLNPSGTPDIVATVVVEVDSVRPCVAADIFRDFNVNGADLGILLSQWGPSTALTVSDLNHDGVVDGSDLGRLLASWGPCP